MFRRSEGNGRKYMLFSIKDLVAAVHASFGSVIPELELFASNNSEVEIEGDPQRIGPALFTVVMNSSHNRGSNSYEPEERELRNKAGIVKAVMGTARSIVGEDANTEAYGIAVAYTFTMMALVLHGSRNRITRFAPYRFSVLMNRITEKVKVANDGDFASILEQVHTLDEETYAAVELGELTRPGAWAWFPMNSFQAKIWGQEHGCDPEVCGRVRARLVDMYKDDGTYLREDEVVNRILDEEREKVNIRDCRRAIMSKHLEAAVRELGLPDSVPFNLKVQFDGDGFDFTDATVCVVKMLGEGGKGFIANLETDDRTANPLSELLGLFSGGGVTLVGVGDND